MKKSVKRTFFTVCLLFCLSGVIFTGYRIWRNRIVISILDNKFYIDTLVQTSLEKEALPTLFLAEKMGLSVDKPENYFTFDPEKATQKLINSGVILKARVRKERPNCVIVEYEPRHPVALVADFADVAVDLNNKLFPLKPLFAPKKLTEIYFGLKEDDREVPKLKFDLGMDVLFKVRSLLEKGRGEILWIDVSKGFEESFGKREVVIKYQEGKTLYYLRVSPDHFDHEAKIFFTMREQLQIGPEDGKVHIVDLRIPKLAFMKEV